MNGLYTSVHRFLLLEERIHQHNNNYRYQKEKSRPNPPVTNRGWKKHMNNLSTSVVTGSKYTQLFSSKEITCMPAYTDIGLDQGAADLPPNLLSPRSTSSFPS